MFANLLFALTTLAYLGLAVFNLQKTTPKGEYLVGSGLMMFGVLAMYVLSSLLLTVNITSKGGFNWLSATPSTRNVMVGILWLGMTAGVVFCAMLSTEYGLDRTTGIVRTLSIPVYFGSVWLPLLMLIPYAILLHPQWRDSLSPTLYKIPLVAACILGVIIFMIPKVVVAMNLQAPKQSQADWKKETLTNSIQNETSMETLLSYLNDEDEWVRQMAAEKIKKDPNYEDYLIKTLSRNDGYGHYDFYRVYMYMDQNLVDHPDRFVEPINSSLLSISTEIPNILAKSFLYSGDLRTLNIDLIGKVLEAQFQNHSDAFRPNMLKIKEALDTPLTQTSDKDPEFDGLLQQYKDSVQAWLDRHPE